MREPKHPDRSSVIWILGASRGLGLACAQRYANDGHTVILSARNADTLKQLTENNTNFIPLALDMTDNQQIIAAFEHIQHNNWLLSKVIINAGDYELTPILSESWQRFNEIIHLNFQQSAFICQHLIPQLQQQTQRCQLVLVGSMAALRGMPFASAYCASKAALKHYAQSIYFELKDSQVDLRLITPGFIDTKLTQKNSFNMPFILTPKQAADYVYRGLNSNKFEIVFPKRFYVIMKTLSLLPFNIYVKALTKKKKT